MLEKFTIADLFKTRSAAVCTVIGNVIRFNAQTAQEMRFPAYIQVLTDYKNKQIAIRECAPDADCAAKFSKPEGQQKGQIKVTAPAITETIRHLMGWGPEDWNLPGILLADEHAIVFDLSSAYEPKHKDILVTADIAK